MTSVLSSTCALMHMFEGKMLEFESEIQNVHTVWLEEIQQEANRMFSSDFSAEPELMPKTPSQKKSNRRKRVSLGRQEEARAKRRFSMGKRSNLRRSSVKMSLNLITEDEGTPKAATSDLFRVESKCRSKQTESETERDIGSASEDETKKTSLLNKESEKPHDNNTGRPMQEDISHTQTDRESVSCLLSTSCSSSVPPEVVLPEAVVQISDADQWSADKVMKLDVSSGRLATKITIAATPSSSRRSSARHSLTVRRSLAGLRHSMTQEAVRRASRRSFLKKKARMGNSTCSSNVSEDASIETDGEVVVEKQDGASLFEDSPDPEIKVEATQVSVDEKDVMVQDFKLPVTRFTRSMAQNTPTNTPPSSIVCKTSDSGSDGSGKKTSLSIIRSQQTSKRKAPDGTGEFLSPRKKPSPPKKCQTAIRPNMRSFLHTVQKNQLLMMTPSSLGRTSVMKSFIKHTTPAKIDAKLGSGVVERERLKLEALKKKQEQEDERKKRMDDDKRKKQEEIKRKRDERLRRVVEARVKEEQKEEEKKKKIEQKMAQIDEKNDKLRFERLAEEKAKKKIASKRQEELEQRRKIDEDARRKKIQEAEEEEKRQQELLVKRRVEEEQDRARKLAEARRALELKKEQERERELEKEKLAASERERAEKEKALMLQREVEKAAREKERRELEEKKKELERKKEEERRLAEERAAKEASAAASKTVISEVQHTVMKTPGKGAGLNVTVDIEQSPQSYEITPKGGKKPAVDNTNPDDYGMDQNSDDSTDDESAPRKPIPSWAEGHILKQAMMKQYFNPVDLHAHFGEIEPPKLENIFYKSKPRYFKRTSSAVWHSPPRMGTLQH